MQGASALIFPMLVVGALGFDPMDYEHVTEEMKNPSKYGLYCVHQDQTKWGEYQCPRMPELRRNWLAWGCCELKPESQFDCVNANDDEIAGQINGHEGHNHCLRCSNDGENCKDKDFECFHDPGFERKGTMTDGHCEQYTWRSRDVGQGIGGPARPGIPHTDLAYNTLCLACHVIDEPVAECRKAWQQLCSLSLHELNKPRCEKRCTPQHCKGICNVNNMDYAGSFDEGQMEDSNYYTKNACSWTDKCIAKCVPRGGSALQDQMGEVMIDHVEYRGYRYFTHHDWDSCGYDIGNPCNLTGSDTGSVVDMNAANMSFDLRLFCPKWNAGNRPAPGWFTVALVVLATNWALMHRRLWFLSTAFLTASMMSGAEAQSRYNTVVFAELLTEIPMPSSQMCASSSMQEPPTAAMAYHDETGRVAVAVGSTSYIYDVHAFAFSGISTVPFNASITVMANLGPWIVVGDTIGKIHLLRMSSQSTETERSDLTLATGELPVPVRSIAACPSNGVDPLKFAAVGLRLRVWEVEKQLQKDTAQIVADVVLSEDEPTRDIVCWKLGGKYYLAAATGLRIQIWEWPKMSLQVAKPLLTLTGHTRYIGHLAWLPQSGFLASGSDSGHAALWEISDVLNEPVKASRGISPFLFQVHDGPVQTLEVVSDFGGSEAVLTGGLAGEVRLWEAKTKTSCGFIRHVRKFLMGNNRVTLLQTELSACLKRCCDLDWCKSIDYQHTEKKPQAANRCILSDTNEEASGSGLTDSAVFDHYVLSRKTGLLSELPQQHLGRVAGAAAFSRPQLPGRVLTLAEGELRLWKSAMVPCPDGTGPDPDRKKCEPCPIGTAGAGGYCRECTPGTYQNKEGQAKCSDCEPGKYSSEERQAHCYSCPKWTLIGESKQPRCKWCPPGSIPDGTREGCITFKKGIEWQPAHASPMRVGWVVVTLLVGVLRTGHEIN